MTGEEKSLVEKEKIEPQKEAIDTVDITHKLLHGPFEDITKMSKLQLKEECQMWRNIWGWVPSEVKYYVARTGTQCAITMRNYKRYLGVLLETHWTLDELELGVYDKVYDVVSGQNYFERKIVKTRIGGIIDLQWIAERTPESEVTGEITEPVEGEPQVGLESAEDKAAEGAGKGMS